MASTRCTQPSANSTVSAEVVAPFWTVSAEVVALFSAEVVTLFWPAVSLVGVNGCA